MPSDLQPASPGLAVSAPRAASADARPGYLFHPVVDFLFLGGASLFILPICMLLPDSIQPEVLVYTLMLANVINHPHFANSYQIFYRNFSGKAFGADYAPSLRARYVFAGIVVPILLIGFLGTGMVQSDARLLGFGANIMGFFVGWHYVKQGYGMLIVDSVLKRQFFDAKEKKVFLIHAYVIWAYTWMSVNAYIAEHDFMGIKHYTFDVPDPLLHIALALAVASGAAALWTLARKWRANGGSLPLNGLVAYAVTLYLWQAFRLDPKFALIVPALHSLQYLLVVWRYELNREAARAPAGDASTIDSLRRFMPSLKLRRFAGFVAVGLVLGFLGFWGIPLVLDVTVHYDKEIFGTKMFVFAFWIFINVHHYFLDNVMWRGENPDTRKYLFAHR